jgi:hypothetical protein
MNEQTLDILIPSRNEEFLTHTIEDILKNIEGDTRIIVGLDGCWPHLPIKDHPRVTIYHTSEPIGQRAITNQLCRLSKAKYVLKCDAHVAFDKGFDVKMMEAFKETGDNVTMIPTMRNLHVFDWVCECGHRLYQGPTPEKCTKCGKKMQKEIIWNPKPNPQSNAYRFDRTMHFQYWNDWGKEQKGDLTETMSIQGSCFMLPREKYWELDICSEEFNSWGQQGVEVACKTWLSGGRVLVNRRTWYAHMFRTQGGDFSFPYENPESKIQENRNLSKELFRDNKWDKAIHDFQWLLDKFNPPEWGELTKGILYYTDNQLTLSIARPVRESIKKANLPITSVSLKPMPWFGNNIHFKGQRSKLTMCKQILAGLKAMKEDIVFFCEHDVIYHPSHFEFTPERKDKFYYNKNIWRVREDGLAVYFDHKSTSQLCCYRDLAIKEYEERVRRIEKEGVTNGYEPGTRSIRRGGYSDYRSEYFESKEPSIDIRHGNNLTASRWNTDGFRDKSTCQNWKETTIDKLWIKEYPRKRCI